MSNVQCPMFDVEGSMSYVGPTRMKVLHSLCWL